MKTMIFFLYTIIFPLMLFAQEVVEQIEETLPWYYNQWLWLIVALVLASIILIVARNTFRKKIHKNNKI